MRTEEGHREIRPREENQRKEVTYSIAKIQQSVQKPILTCEREDPIPSPNEEHITDPTAYRRYTSSLDFGDIPRDFRCRSGIPQWQCQPNPLVNPHGEDKMPPHNRSQHPARIQQGRRFQQTYKNSNKLTLSFAVL